MGIAFCLGAWMGGGHVQADASAEYQRRKHQRQKIRNPQNRAIALIYKPSSSTRSETLISFS